MGMSKRNYVDLSMSERISLFYEKNDLLDNTLDFNLEKVDLYDFYNLVFKRDGDLPFQEKRIDNGLDYSKGQYNSILVNIDGDNSKSWIVTKDLDILDNFIDNDFVITSPITFVGRNRNANNSRYIYGLAFDIDGVFIHNLRDILHQMNHNYIPKANIIVNSGNGVHLYYLFEKPIALYPNVKKLLQNLKYGLTRRLWNMYTSSIKDEQFQGIFQGFRVPDTKTKIGTSVTAYEFKDAEYVNIEYLNSFISSGNDLKLTSDQVEIIQNAEYTKNKVSLSRAKELYPDWYERRIVKGEKRAKWNIKRDLYEWWLSKIQYEDLVKEGHRYFCIMTLAMYAVKCNVPYEELERDAYNLLEPMESISSSDDNHFTEEDIKDALRAYKDNYATFPRKDIEKITGIRIDPNKRNYQKQADHLEEARMIRDLRQKRNGTKWTDNNGRKSKDQIVAKWRYNNPQGKKVECIRETGLSKPTVYKHWNSECNKETKMKILIEKYGIEYLDKVLDAIEKIKERRRNGK